MATPTTDTLRPTLMRSLRTFTERPTRMVPQGSPVYHKLHDAGLIKIIGTRYGHGCGRHASLLWEAVLTDAGRAILANEGAI